MQNKNHKIFKKGMGVIVKIPGDLNKKGKQKIRPGIIIKSYPSHIKIQLLSTQPNKNDYYSIKINNKISYIRSIYYKTISIDEIKNFWYEKGKQIMLDPNSKFFEKLAEMEYKEIYGQNLSYKRKKEVPEFLNKEFEIEYE